MRINVYLLLTVLATFSLLSAEPLVETESVRVLKRYLDRVESHQSILRPGSVEVDIEASLPKLRKSGRMHALKYVSGPGRVTYQVLSFTGDNMIKKEVISRYLTAENKSLELGKQHSLLINEDNYTFVHRGAYGSGDWKLHLFELRPRKKRLGLYQGWLWIEATTGLPVRESGRLVKNPSVFVSQVEFLRDYQLRDGVAVPVRIESSVETRLVGTARLSIWFGESTYHRNHSQLTSHNGSIEPSPVPET